MKKQQEIAVVGPTASGKSSFALALAKELKGEIVGMDSMQIYQHMNIGTAKATLEERKIAPHHMIDILPPTATYSVAQYRQQAANVIEEIFARGNQPILVGGTGLYYQAILQPMELGNSKANRALRKQLEEIAAKEGGKEQLHQLLCSKDPRAGEKIHQNDQKRVIRALEVIDETGKPFSDQKGMWKEDPPYQPIGFAMEIPREKLYARIEKRVDEMMEKGLLEEIGELLAMGVDPKGQSMQGIGYKELIPAFKQEESLQEAILLLKKNTRKYAKRQLTWFRRYDHITWLDFEGENIASAMKILESVEDRING